MFIVERVSALEHIFSFQTPSRVLGRGFEKKKYLGQSCFFSLIYLDYNIEVAILEEKKYKSKIRQIEKTNVTRTDKKFKSAPAD